METLNADCIFEILKFLDMKDQISMLQVNIFLQHIVRLLWKVQYKRAAINFLEHKLTDNEYEIFFTEIKDFAEVLELRFMGKHQYEILKRCIYPNVTNLRLTLHPVFLKDEDIIDLYRIFPNLTAFSPHGNLTGKYLDLWQLQLKALNLSYCTKLDLQQFHHLMKILHLEHVQLNVFPISKQYEQLDLQEAQVEQIKSLKLNTYEFYYFLSKPLPNIKELIICNQYNPRQLFDVILATWPANEIRSLETANVEYVLANCIEMNMNVTEICICNDDYVLPVNVMKSLYLLTDMRKLRLKNCKLYKVDIAQLLKSVPQCDEVSLEDCRLDEQNVVLNVPAIVEQRTKALKLNFYNNQPRMSENSINCMNDFEPIVSVSLLANHPLFEVTKKRGSDLTFEPLYIKFR